MKSVFAIALAFTAMASTAKAADQIMICEGSGYEARIDISAPGWFSKGGKPSIFQFHELKKDGAYVYTNVPNSFPGDDRTCFGGPEWNGNVVGFACDRVTGRNGWTGSPNGRVQIFGSVEMTLTSKGTVESIVSNNLKLTLLINGVDRVLADSMTCSLR